MIAMIEQAALTAAFVLVAIGLGAAACYWLLYPSKPDEAEQTWRRTAVKETKAPPIGSPQAAQVRMDERIAMLGPPPPKHKPDNITLAKVRKAIKKGRK